MNKLLEDIVATLLNDSEIAEQVAARVYPDQATQGAATPYLIYQEISFAGSYNLAGPDGTRARRIQFDAYGPTKSAVVAIISRVLALFDGQKQTLNNRTAVLFCQIEGGQSGYESEHRLYRNRLDLTFNYRS